MWSIVCKVLHGQSLVVLKSTRSFLGRFGHKFLCFYAAIFKLTSAKFQTFAYNSRTCTFVPNFEAIGYVTWVLGPKNLPESLT